MAKNVSDLLNESFFGNSADVEDFRPSLVANCVFNSFLSYTTIILNILTIHAIRKTALLPKPLRTLLLSLAASDVGVGLLAQPLFISILVSWLKRSRIDPISFKGLMAVMSFFCVSSLFNVVTISVDRFLAVHLHLRYQELVTHKRVIAAVISIWLFSAIISSSVFWDSLSIISLIVWLVIMTVCLIVVVTVYWRIYIILKRHKNQIQSLQISEVQQGVQNGDLSNFLRLRKSALGTFYVCIVFLICYLPYYILLFFYLAYPLSPISLNEVWPHTVTLVFLNSSLNPVIYCWKMGPIRRTLMDIKVRKSAHGTFYVFIVFLICFLPSYVLSFLLLSRTLNLISLYEAWLYTTTFFFLNSSLNPVIYCWKMRSIRRTLMDIMPGILNRFRE